jgi:diguanylate cyclase (GGDEF)-like protein
MPSEARPLGLLFIDLDGFKAINDAHGHLAGDRLLRATARRLVRVAPAGATVTRFGGDEFVVLLPAMDDADAATTVAQAMRNAVIAPLRLSGRRVSLTCSIGVALGPRDANTADELVRAADRAMLEAKAGGRNQVCLLDVHGQQRLDRRGRLRRELGEALDKDRLNAAFQPLLDLRTGLVAGVELLARWHDPEMGHVSPAEFIPLAEESGLIGALGAWALREGLRAGRALRTDGHLLAGSDLRVAVNVSPVQLADAELVHTLMSVVQAEGGDPRWIELELTESVQLAEDEACLDRLRQLRELGFHLTLDDFGAGYSSFSYLSRLYFERLKIDRALVQAALHAPERTAVTASIIAMAHGLGLTVAAEGIETPAQQALLAAQGCDVVQGYHIARPMPLADLLVWRPARAELPTPGAVPH